MTEIQAPYRVGNIVYVDFERAPARMRSRAKIPASIQGNDLWRASESAYLTALNTPEQFTSESRAALVLALTKLLEAETDGDCCVLLALRLATIQMQLAVTAGPNRSDAMKFLVGQAIEQLQSILGHLGGGTRVIEDADQLIVAPAAIYIRLAVAHRLMHDESNALTSLEIAESSLERLNLDGGDWARAELLRQIVQLRGRDEEHV